MTAWLINLGTSAINRLLPFLLILIAGVLIIRIIRKIINAALAKSKLEKAAHSLIKSLTNTVLYLLLGLIAASSLGIDVTGIIALASLVIIE